MTLTHHIGSWHAVWSSKDSPLWSVYRQGLKDVAEFIGLESSTASWTLTLLRLHQHGASTSLYCAMYNCFFVKVLIPRLIAEDVVVNSMPHEGDQRVFWGSCILAVATSNLLFASDFPPRSQSPLSISHPWVWLQIKSLFPLICSQEWLPIGFQSSIFLPTPVLTDFGDDTHWTQRRARGEPLYYEHVNWAINIALQCMLSNRWNACWRQKRLKVPLLDIYINALELKNSFGLQNQSLWGIFCR